MPKVGIFLATRIFDVGLTAAAATAAVVAGAHAAGATLTPSMVHTAAVGGAVKSAAMSIAGFLMLAPVSTPFIILPILVATSIGTNVLLVAAVADLVLGHGEFAAGSQSLNSYFTPLTAFCLPVPYEKE